MRLRRYIAVLLFTILICGEVCPDSGMVKAVKASGQITLYRGKSIYLKIPGKKKRAGRSYRYKSSRPSVISVSKKGRVKAKKAGTAVVTMRRKGKAKTGFRTRIRVVDYVKKVSVNTATQIVMKAGEEVRIRAEVLPRTAGNRGLTYQSENEAVAKVSKAGRIMAIDEGMVYIGVTSRGKDKKGRTVGTKILVSVSSDAPQVSAPVFPSPQDTVLQSSIVTEMPTNPASPSPTEMPSETASPDTQQSPVVTKSPVSDPTVSNEPLNTAMPSKTSMPSETALPAATQKPPQTLSEYVAAIPSPSAQTLVAARFVTASGGRLSTLYFLNPSFTGTVSLVVDGIPLQSSGSVASMMKRLQDEAGVFLQGPSYTDKNGNSRRVFRIGRNDSTEPWVIQNRRDGTEYSLYALAVDTRYHSPYGVIVADGDTSLQIIVQ